MLCFEYLYVYVFAGNGCCTCAEIFAVRPGPPLLEPFLKCGKLNM